MYCKIILVNWKRASDTCACISSLIHDRRHQYNIVICENGSPDNSAEQIDSFLSLSFIRRSRGNVNGAAVVDFFKHTESSSISEPSVTLVLGRENLGFAGGNNLALSATHPDIYADYVWFLNNDTEVEPDTLDIMIERMQADPMIGICGSTLVYAHDRKTIQAYGGATYSKWTGAVREIGNQNSRFFPVDREAVEAEMDYVSGASMLVSRRFLEEVGPMSEDYFLYYEEVDWAVRARKAGYRLGYAPDAIVYHKEGAVLGSGSSSGRSLLAEYYGVRNRVVFTRKFFPWALPTVYLFSAMQVVRRCIQGRWAHARLMAEVLLGLCRVAPGTRQ